MNKIILIGGPTGVGKTKLSLEVCDKFNGYLISCDSMQIYKDMNIGTAKIDKKTQKEYPHKLIDIISPSDSFSVSDYVNLAKQEIENAKKQNKIPIIVGGTGLYMKSLLFPYSFSKTQKNQTLREELKKLSEEKGNEFLYNILLKKNEERAKQLHPNDVKRVIRSLEILESGEIENVELKSEYDYKLIVLDEEREVLYEKINRRVEEMFSLGLEEEVENVIKKYNLTEENQSMQAIGYKEFFDYFDKKISKNELIETIKLNSRHYAKRQLTWFRSMPKAEFKNFSEKDKIMSEIECFLRE